MAYVVKDRVKVTSTTTGTGTFTLGAAAVGFQSFGSLSASSAWNISTASFFQNFSTSGIGGGNDLFFKPDGLKMYIVGTTGDSVYEYNLSTAWSVSTASFLQSKVINAQDTDPSGLFFKPDGLKMYVTGNTNDSVYEYDLSTAWDVTSASYLQTFSVSAQEITPQGLFFKSDGLKMYIIGSTGDDVNEYNLSSAWNISTASYLQNFSVAAQQTTPYGIFFKTDGLQMYVSGAGDAVYQYNLTTAWNVSTASYFQSYSVGTQDTASTGIFFNPNGSPMYIVGDNNNFVSQYELGTNQTYYCITDGTNWEVGIGTYTASGTTLSRSPFESSNSNALVDFPAGIKDVFVTFPSENTLGTVPTADNSSVGTDLVAWLNLKKKLDAGVVNGVPYANNGTNGIGSTYSLVYTVASAYCGGVLAPNGEIYFVPDSANRGQKVNTLSGVVSTYSLVYTANTAYQGGVLASNGDIHFIPHNANRGQKVNSSGVVSTYSLVYTAGNSYFGGVLAPNGDIHFIPYGANRGQKISSTGVVSTYSLIITGTTQYAGGVLTPDGDIHFVPFRANRGQKISSTGVVSTYSLVYTLSGQSYAGGVLASNGDIHFVPRNAVIGQKVSVTGVVSTYSLVYTAGNAYAGGVLAPNGDIHFMPNAATIGQKISAAGVVSTYSLVYTGGGNDITLGGVLAPSGDIYFVPFNANLASKISTNVQQKIGYALSPHFNKF